MDVLESLNSLNIIDSQYINSIHYHIGNNPIAKALGITRFKINLCTAILKYFSVKYSPLNQTISQF